MAGVREVKGRIKTVRNIQQITKAMKMVAAARIKRAETRLKAARPYTQKMQEVLDELVANLGESAHPLMTARPVKRIALIIVSADKGLCGAYNSNLLRSVQTFINEHPSPKSLLVFGSKAVRWLQRRQIATEGTTVGFKATFQEASEAASKATAWYIDGKVDEVHCIFTEMVSAATQKPKTVKLLPLAVKPGATRSALPYIFEPSPEAALNVVIPRYLDAMLFSMLLESRAAELASRLKAMSNATDNADDLASALTLQYFRARQDQITRELIEISSGAAAMKKS